MKRLMMGLAVLLLTAAPALAQQDGLRETGRACVFGGAVLGISSLLVLAPAVAAAETALPATSLVLGNTVFGCGIAALGALAASTFTWVYDGVVGTVAPAPVLVPLPPAHGGATKSNTI